MMSYRTKALLDSRYVMSAVSSLSVRVAFMSEKGKKLL